MNQHILPFSAPAFTLDNTVPAPHLSEPGFHALGAAAPRPQAQMTSSEEQTVRAIATQNTKAGAHARTILEMAYGEPATFEVERIEGLGERSAEIAEKEMGDLGGT